MENKDEIAWDILGKYFHDNPDNLVNHHLESYNEFFSDGIFRVFRECNPIRFTERIDCFDGTDNNINDKKPQRNKIEMFLGGREGKRIYFGKPIIYDQQNSDPNTKTNENGGRSHYMYPNDARLRNMTYAASIYYDVEVEFTFYNKESHSGSKPLKHTELIEKVFLGKVPIMLNSNLCILKGLSREIRFNMGECRNDRGGYFIVDGKEKVIISQQTIANNMIYVYDEKGQTQKQQEDQRNLKIRE